MTPERFGHGLVLGKFYPPHRGHKHLIESAAARCDAVTVLVMAASCESIPLADRVGWLRADLASLPAVVVTGVRCDAPVDFADPMAWDAQLAVMRAALRQAGQRPMDAVFSSEPYGAELARRLGGCHVAVDPARRAVPVSASRIRADPAGCWHHLTPAVRAGLAARVVVVGAESTGTTAIARGLAARYRDRGGAWARTRCVPEAG